MKRKKNNNFVFVILILALLITFLLIFNKGNTLIKNKGNVLKLEGLKELSENPQLYEGKSVRVTIIMGYDDWSIRQPFLKKITDSQGYKFHILDESDRELYPKRDYLIEGVITKHPSGTHYINQTLLKLK